MDNQQLTHEHYKNDFKKREIIVLCDHVKSPANIGGIFRLADAFAVSEIIFHGTQIDLTSNRLKKTARNTHESIPFHESENLIGTIETLKTQGYSILALEITSQSKSIATFEVATYDKIALIIGDERNGISTDILNNYVNHTLHIPMYGRNSSMNVAQATAIALYSLSL